MRRERLVVLVTRRKGVPRVAEARERALPPPGIGASAE